MPAKTKQNKTPTPQKDSKLIRIAKKLFVPLSATILGLSTLYWSLLAGDVHNHNADQLVSALEAAHPSSTILPAAHTFLFKFPLFFLNHLFGSSYLSFIILTALVSLLTVGTFAYVLYRIEKRPFVFGTILLVMASMLMYIAPEVRPGVPLPVNFAMLTTRNLEYILYIGALYFIIKATKASYWKAILGIGLLALLIASDKLFLVLSLGGACILGGYALLFFNKQLIRRAVIWLGSTIIAWGLGTVLLAGLQAIHAITLNGTSAVNPYSLSFNIKAFLYAIHSLTTNFGANIVYDLPIGKPLFVDVLSRIATPLNIGYGLNFLLLLLLITLSTRIFKKPKDPVQADKAIVYALISSTIVAIAAYVFTKHEYVVDSRYLTIAFFAVFLATTYATRYISDKTLKTFTPYIIAVSLIGVGVGAMYQTQLFIQSKDANSKMTSRNIYIADALKQTPNHAFVADYWRLEPIRLHTENKRTPMIALSDCTQVRSVLTTTKNEDWKKKPFVYLLSLEKGFTDFPDCSGMEALEAFGFPNRSLVIDGTIEEPNEVLLYYDNGIDQVGIEELKKEPLKEQEPILGPSAFDELGEEAAICKAKNIMNIVAHQDDDILFMSPDIQHDADAGNCLRAVFVTAGDASNDKAYWISRQLGIQAAYAQLYGVKNDWHEQKIKFGDKRYATVATLRGDKRATLIFLQLPDGNITGGGFARTGRQSIEKLYSNQLPHIRSVDNSSEYTKESLTETLTELMTFYKPSHVRTQSFAPYKGKFSDHPDHKATAKYANDAFKRFNKENSATIQFYKGYPVQDHSENVKGEDLKRKIAVFMAYAKHDSATCETYEICRSKTVYGKFLNRQYHD